MESEVLFMVVIFAVFVVFALLLPYDTNLKAVHNWNVMLGSRVYRHSREILQQIYRVDLNCQNKTITLQVNLRK